MSSFLCEHCYAPIVDSPRGYITSCEHYPAEGLSRQAKPTDYLLVLLIEESAKASAEISIRGEAIRERPPMDDGMVIYATRYALGRASYAPGEVTHYLTCHWDKFQPKTRSVLVTDIEEALATGRYGMEMDRQVWMQVLERARR